MYRFTHVRPQRVLLALAAALVVMAALASGAWAIAPSGIESSEEPMPAPTQPAPAPSVAPTFERTITVKEADAADVSTGLNLQYKDRVSISASGAIESGVWFAGWNGPQGWDTYDCAEKFPLPCSRPFSLLKRIGTSGYTSGYSYVGRGQDFLYDGRSGELLSLRINDDTPANGKGAFTAVVRVWR